MLAITLVTWEETANSTEHGHTSEKHTERVLIYCGKSELNVENLGQHMAFGKLLESDVPCFEESAAPFRLS